MKKASFTLFQPQRWMSKGLSTLVVLFVMCMGLTTATAQRDTITIGDAKGTVNTCTGTVSSSSSSMFVDDGGNDGNYADSKERSDTTTICAKDGNTVKVVFTDFDVAPGDTLFAFQGDKKALDAAGAAAAKAASVKAAAAALAAAQAASIPDSIAKNLTIPASQSALEALAATTLDSAGVEAAVAAGYLPKGLNLADAPTLATAIKALGILAAESKAAAASLGLGTLEGTTGASEGTGSGQGVGATSLAVGRGGSVSDAFGGWIDADVDPSVNPSGCLTFVFKTNGDRAKGSGWEAWVDCAPRNINIEAPKDIVITLNGNDKPFVDTAITAPKVTSNGTAIRDSVLVIVVNQAGKRDTLRTNLSASAGGLPPSASKTFALGIYTVHYVLLSDPTKRQTSTVTVQAPNLVCNDNVIIPFGSACAVAITPDMILEQPAAAIPGGTVGGVATAAKVDTMSYSIKLTIGTKEYTDGMLTKERIREAGMTVCDGTATVSITRTYGNVWGAGVYNNGTQSQTCSTDLTFDDASNPIFISAVQANDTIVACSVVDILKLIGTSTNGVEAIDNCDSVRIEVDTAGLRADLTKMDLPCFSKDSVMVTYTAIDECDNMATQERKVIILRPSEFLMAASDTLKCNSTDDSKLKPGLLIGNWKNAKLVATDTVELFEDKYECGYILTHEDVTVPSDCGEKVFRTWKSVDWCKASAPSTIGGAGNSQFILYTDSVDPVFDASDYGTRSSAKMVELGPFECSTNEGIPTRTATDDCVGGAVDAVATDTVVIDGEIVDGKFTCGTYRINYRAEDKCGNAIVDSVFFTVKDVTPPSAICTDELIVSIGSGAVRITASDLNAGSYDACETLTYKVRKAGTEAWLDHVALTCSDKPSVEVELQVTGSKSAPVTCWSKITVEDKIAPVCTILADSTKNCTDFHPTSYGENGTTELVAGSTLAKFYNDNFGNPFDGCSDNCVTLTTQYQSIDVTRGDCGQITIERTYKVVDWANIPSPTYKQTITVNPVSDFKLTFPADQEISCGAADQTVLAASSLDQILTENNGCDVFALEVTEKEFTVDGDFCKKIERTYEVINWCTYTPGSPAQPVPHVAAGGSMVTDETAGTNGRFVYTQIIKYSVDQAPTVTITTPDMCINSGCGEMKTFSASAENCLGAALTNFTYKLKVTDASGKVTTRESESDTVNVNAVPGSSYEVEFWVSDDCGNSAGASLDQPFNFMDCVRPTPYVLNGLAVEIMQTGEIAVWASDLDRGSFDNCTDKDKGLLDIRIALGTPEDGPGRNADADAVRDHSGNAVTFNCDLLGTTQFVSIYVIDEKGNWDVVGTYVFVQDNLGVCPGVDPMSGRVAGKVTNAFGENVELVNVTVNGGDNSMATNATGEFAFNLPLDGDYTITPEKDINPLNGVSTFDLVLISKHILGLQQFDSPYKYIAADVNKSGSITAFDMVQLRQLILNVTSEFTNNTSWRFVDAKHEFTSANPAAENFDEFMSINNLDGEMLSVDFIAAKIGDVNGTATANSLLGAESRNVNGTLNLNVTDQLVAAGETVTVDFTSADIAAAQGYQFTMDFAGLNLVELNEGVAKAANFNTNIAERGVLTTSWNGEATANDVLFSLTFTAATNGLLSELISVNSDLTTAEAYNNAGELMNVALDFNTTDVATAFGLNQNTPNPFNGETVIGFNLPEAGAATLTVMDVQGKVLTVIERDGVRGYNQVTINAKTLSATGVLYYQLESADNIATKKMIIIE